MKQNVDKITQEFVSRLPDDQKHYLISNIEQQFPDFLVKLIRYEALQKLASSIEEPKSSWADLTNRDVKAAWTDYIGTLENHLQIPANEVEPIIKSAVKRCLKMSASPLKSIPEILFEQDSELGLEEINRRAVKITVHAHLASALLRFMEKKNLETLTADKAKDIVQKIDQKLTKDFNALNWAHYLEPLFELAGPETDTGLFRIFFEERGKNKIARKFELMDGSINKSDFIEVISSAEMLDLEGYEEDQPSLFTTTRDVEEAPWDEDDPEEAEKKTNKTEEDKGGFEPVEFEEEGETVVDSFNKGAGEVQESDITGEAGEEVETEEELIRKESDGSQEYDEPDELEGESEKKQDPVNKEFVEEATEIETEEENEEAQEEDDQLDEQEETIHTPFQHKPDSEKLSISEEYSFRGSSITGEDTEEQEEDEEETALHSRFVFDEDYSDSDEEDNPRPSTIYDEMELVRDEDDLDEKKSVLSLFEEETKEKGQEVEEEDNEAFFTDEGAPEEMMGLEKEESTGDMPDKPVTEENARNEEEEESDEDDVPMWRSFLEREDTEDDEFAEEENESQQVVTDEDGFIDEPIIDLTQEEDPNEKIEQVEKWLSGDRERFVDAIFSGSDIAYETALSQIIDFDDWKSASRYIEKEVFSRNLVDVYDEDAVDFTDRLHSYFKEFKS